MFYWLLLAISLTIAFLGLIYRRRSLPEPKQGCAKQHVESALKKLQQRAEKIQRQKRSACVGTLTCNAVTEGELLIEIRAWSAAPPLAIPPFLSLGESATVSCPEMLRQLPKPDQAVVRRFFLEPSSRLEEGIVHREHTVRLERSVDGEQCFSETAPELEGIWEALRNTLGVAEIVMTLAPKAFDWLLRFAKTSGSIETRLGALHKLLRYYGQEEKALEYCRYLLERGSSDEQVIAAIQLGVDGLADFIVDRQLAAVQEQTALAAICALENCASRAQLRQVASSCLMHQSVEVVTRALLLFAGEPDFVQLKLVLDEPGNAARRCVVEYLRDMAQPESEQLLLWLVQQLGDTRETGSPDLGLKEATIRSLAKTGTAASVPVLRQLACSPREQKPIKKGAQSSIEQIQKRISRESRGGLAVTQTDAGELAMASQSAQLTLHRRHNRGKK